MTVRTVVRYPARVLKGPAGPVGSIGTRERQVATDLVDSMYDAPGCVGLAAPQLGIALRVFALDVSVMKKPASRPVRIDRR
ncbi:MAG: peptide deformylase [Intrasporangiaceae bacterium]|nr:peptide deformylase [Intrasporangiaceae bacterium]